MAYQQKVENGIPKWFKMPILRTSRFKLNFYPNVMKFSGYIIKTRINWYPLKDFHYHSHEHRKRHPHWGLHVHDLWRNWVRNINTFHYSFQHDTRIKTNWLGHVNGQPYEQPHAGLQVHDLIGVWVRNVVILTFFKSNSLFPSVYLSVGISVCLSVSRTSTCLSSVPYTL